jgi:hypothetical protein
MSRSHEIRKIMALRLTSAFGENRSGGCRAFNMNDERNLRRSNNAYFLPGSDETQAADVTIS